jgi:hypothetical protein
MGKLLSQRQGYLKIIQVLIQGGCRLFTSSNDVICVISDVIIHSSLKKEGGESGGPSGSIMVVRSSRSAYLMVIIMLALIL